jgi:hypothetical protein
MRSKTRFWKGITGVLVLIAALLVTGAAAAQEEEIELIGAVTAVSPENGSFQIEVEDESGELELITVLVPEDFNFDTLEAGDIIEVEGLFNQDGDLVLSDYSIEERSDDLDDEDDQEEEDEENYFCTSTEDQHPVAASMAETYGVSYEEIMAWFCGVEGEEGQEGTESVGLGQIMLALQTAEVTGESADTYLQSRKEGQGWGQIWQEADLIGKPDKKDPPGKIREQDQEGKPEDKMPPGLEKKQGICEEDEEGCEDWMPPGLQKKQENGDGEWVPPGQRGR